MTYPEGTRQLKVKKLIIGLISVACLLVSFSCAPAPAASTTTPAPVSEPPIPAHFATYTDEAGFFNISYPPDWEPFPSWFEELGAVSKDFFKSYDSDTSFIGLFFVFIAEAPRSLGGSSASVNIVVQALSDMTIRGWRTLDEIVEAKLRRTKEIKEGYHEFSRVSTIIDGREAVIIDWESYTSDSSRKARCIQMFIIADKLVWKVTCYADSEKFSDFEDDLHAIVRSLRILK
ncbi:hypothetical protein ES708_24329 [subsurface metagenome]